MEKNRQAATKIEQLRLELEQSGEERRCWMSRWAGPEEVQSDRGRADRV